MHDLLIIGGGINGCGIARDAAGRGLSVLLAEKGDLGGGTSSASTKLVHGGLRYLENYEFRLVRESLREREILLGLAPHIIRPLRFVLPYEPHLRPAWMLSAGLFLYDHLGGRKQLPASRRISLRRHPAGAPLKGQFVTGFEYSDCWVDDARLVVLNAMDAAERGATILRDLELIDAVRTQNYWRATFRNTVSGAVSQHDGRALINATGPWINDALSARLGIKSARRVRLVKGSHIVVPRLFTHDYAYIFQNADRRIIFAIPYERDFTLIGTTDVDFDSAPETAKISPDEILYLCDAASAYFSAAVLPDHVVWSYAGVRPLLDDHAESAQSATRDFLLDLNREGAPLLNVFGGKITTYRRLAEAALDKLGADLPTGAAWTHDAPLPGGDISSDESADLAERLQAACNGLGADLAMRWVRTFGARAWTLLEGASTRADLGLDFGAGLSEREVRYLRTYEWARNADDILWRRTKLGLHMPADGQDKLRAWLDANPASL